MTIDWWTLGLETLNVVILVWLLAHFLFRPVRRIIAERQKVVSAALEEAEDKRRQADAQHAAALGEAEGIATHRADLIAQAQADAEREKQQLLDIASKEAEKNRSDLQAELADMRRAEARRIADEAGILAIDIATRLLDRLPDTARITGFVEGLIEAVSDLPDKTRAGIGRDGPVQLRVARALTRGERNHLQGSLEALLGRKIALEIAIDPDLIAGLELDAPHAIVRNHFRFDLERIRMELSGHG